MGNTKEIEVMESVYDRNEETARRLNEQLTERQIFTVNVMGAPGVGKTTSLVNLIPKLPLDAFVIEGDIESDIDTKKLTELGIKTVQINTGGACHLDSPLIEDAAQKLNLQKGFLFIENIGNLVCPAEFVIGEHVKMLISTVTEGSDKPYKYPLAFEKADVILLGKCDLLEHVDFDVDMFMNGVRKLNPTVPVIKTSGKTGLGFDEAANWIVKKAESVLK